MELMRAIPTPAPVPVRHSDDIAQNGPNVPQIPTAAKDKAASSAAGALEKAAIAKPTAPAKAHTATCHRRSRLWSELLPMMIIPNDAAIKGIALTNPTSRSLK